MSFEKIFHEENRQQTLLNIAFHTREKLTNLRVFVWWPTKKQSTRCALRARLFTTCDVSRKNSRENQFWSWRLANEKSHSDVRHIRWERRSCMYYADVTIPRHFINYLKH